MKVINNVIIFKSLIKSSEDFGTAQAAVGAISRQLGTSTQKTAEILKT